MEFGAQVDDETSLFVGLVAHQAFILRIVQQLAELLETVLAPVEFGLLLAHPFGQFVRQRAVVHLEAVRFQHVAQQGDGLLGPVTRLVGGGAAALHADHVAAFAAGDLDKIGLLQLLDEIGE